MKSIPAKITLLTNGMALARHAPDVVRWCDEVIVSLDGTEETHDALRGVGGATGRLAEGIAALRALAPTLPITGRCVLQRRNYREMDGDSGRGSPARASTGSPSWRRTSRPWPSTGRPRGMRSGWMASASPPGGGAVRGRAGRDRPRSGRRLCRGIHRASPRRNWATWFATTRP